MALGIITVSNTYTMLFIELAIFPVAAAQI